MFSNKAFLAFHPFSISVFWYFLYFHCCVLKHILKSGLTFPKLHFIFSCSTVYFLCHFANTGSWLSAPMTKQMISPPPGAPHLYFQRIRASQGEKLRASVRLLRLIYAARVAQSTLGHTTCWSFCIIQRAKRHRGRDIGRITNSDCAE